MEKADIYNLLSKNQIQYEVLEHRAVFSMKEITDLEMLYPEDEAKNLFIRDDKRERYYLITVKGDKKVDLKAFRRKNNTRHLSFASSEELLKFMKLTPGSVTPFGLLNDEERRVEFFLDKEFLEGNARIGCHPNENTTSIWLKTEKLLDLLKQHGTKIQIVEL